MSALTRCLLAAERFSQILGVAVERSWPSASRLATAVEIRRLIERMGCRSRSGAGAGTAGAAADRHHRSGFDHHRKLESRCNYQGGRGYQPMLAAWAEMNLIVVRPVSQWERPGATGAAGRGATGV